MNDRIIIEILERISILEEKVNNVQRKQNEDNISNNEIFETNDLSAKYKHNDGKDHTRFMLDGVVYVKSRLVHAIVMKYIQSHPDTTADELQHIFDKSLQGTFRSGKIT